MKATGRALTVSALLAALAAVATAQEGVWTSHGPTDVGMILDLAIADSVAYAGTPNGVFVSSDGGVTWRQSGLAGEWIQEIVTLPGAPVVLAGREFVYFASRDRGETWVRLSEDHFYAVAMDPGDVSTVYAASTIDYSIWRSIDAGTSWHRHSAGPGSPKAFAFNSGAIYLLSYSDLYRSLDGGLSWSSIASGLQGGAIATGAQAGVVYRHGDGGFCRSPDSGATWTCSSSLPFAGFQTAIVEVAGGDPANPRLLAGSSQGIFLSTNGGATWTPAGSGVALGGFGTPLAVDSSGSLILAGNDSHVLRSQDRGDTWIPARVGLDSLWVGALAVDPRVPSTVWAGGYGYGHFGPGTRGPGLFRSEYAGLSWSRAGGPEGPEYVSSIAIDPQRPLTMYVGGSDLFRTDDGGQTWVRPRYPEASSFVSTFGFDPNVAGRVWASIGRLAWSDDGGQTWEPSSLAQHAYCLAFDGRKPGTMYAGSYFEVTRDQWGDPHIKGGSIFVSHDNGATFTKSTRNFGSPVLSIATDPFQGSVAYAVTRSGGIFRSDDGGVSWGGGSVGFQVLAIVADPIRSGRLYCGTDRGVFRTIDGARTWHLLSTGLPTTLPTESLAISPDGRWLHAGTGGGGVFDLDLEGRPPLVSCVPSDTRLCLVGNRYAVELTALRQNSDPPSPGIAHSLGDRAGYFGLPFATGDPDLPEIFVKMLPAGAFGGSAAPVFYASLTTLTYTLTVTDTLTGSQRDYTSNSEAPLCGRASLAFGVQEATLVAGDEPKADDPVLELLGGRFTVTLEAVHPRSGAIAAGATMLSGDRFGIFSLPAVTGDAQFPEVVVKMVDGRATTGKFWFFHTGLTSLHYTLTVTDSVTGAVQVYENAGDFCGGADTSAFTD